MENIFWIGLIVIIVFLLIRYRILENKIQLYKDFDKIEEIEALKKSINKIESELNYINEKYRS
ncbi:MAG: hypothetical protein ACR2L5_01415 [Candidatus Actinomarinaceae bacterium]